MVFFLSVYSPNTVLICLLLGLNWKKTNWETTVENWGMKPASWWLEKVITFFNRILYRIFQNGIRGILSVHWQNARNKVGNTMGKNFRKNWEETNVNSFWRKYADEIGGKLWEIHKGYNLPTLNFFMGLVVFFFFYLLILKIHFNLFIISLKLRKYPWNSWGKLSEKLGKIL